MQSVNFHKVVRHHQERKRQVCQQGVDTMTGPPLGLEAETVERLQIELADNL